MKVLFVCSGNNSEGISTIVFNQGESIKRNGISVDYFTINEKGFLGYIKNILRFRKFLINNKFDLIHAHYSLSGLVVSFALPKSPVIVSLMGSDLMMNYFWNVIIRLNCLLIWDAVLVKSCWMKRKLKVSKTLIIPNGVDLEKFNFRNKLKAQEKLGFDSSMKHIIFLSNPNRYEKNFSLADKAIRLLSDKSVVLHPVFKKPYNQTIDYLYASDLLILTSFWEGSPNVIKEAMACNCPVVSTDVGDVRWLLGGTEGCYIASYEPEDVANKIKSALAYGKRTNARQRIIELGLDSETVAKRIITLYKEVIGNQ